MNFVYYHIIYLTPISFTLYTVKNIDLFKPRSNERSLSMNLYNFNVSACCCFCCPVICM